MSSVSRYWKLIRLDATGHRKAQELPEAKAFFQAQFADWHDPVHTEIQAQLLQQARSGGVMAELCLRCFISTQIEQVCINLEQQFGLNHGFFRQDLFPLVLDDDGKIGDSKYVSVARNILNSFEASKGSLSTWTIRLVKHHRELNQFLLESGVCLLSDWAILNDTTPSKLRRVLREFHHISAYEIEQATALLEAYHAVYRADRLIQRQAGAKGACPAPTEDQLVRMQQELGDSGNPRGTPRGVLGQLQRLADQLRQYRIASRVGRLPTVSMDKVADGGEGLSLADRLASPSPQDDETTGQTEFLLAYRAQFAQVLEQSFQDVVQARYQKQKGEKATHFITALQLFHCQGRSMTEIAKAVGLQAQFQVSRLLNLKTLREDVRHQMLQRLRSFVSQKAADMVSPDRLQQLDAQIEIALNEQIENLMQEAAAQAQSPKDYVTGTLFSRTLCQLLDTFPAV
jgi:hypothetical protein